MFGKFVSREMGIKPFEWKKMEKARRTYLLDLSHLKEIRAPHTKAIMSLDYDTSDGRYLLSASADGTITLYDLQRTYSGKSCSFATLATVVRPAPRGATATSGKTVSSVCWYPFDTGMFISGDYFGDVCLWDTNKLEVALTFELKDEVHCTAMSHCATHHALIAVGSGDEFVHMCDIRTGKSVQVLQGHAKAVRTVQWCPGDEHCLASGSSDGTLRLWDLRKATGSVKAFNQHSYVPHTSNDTLTQAAKIRQGYVVDKAHNGAVVSCCFTPDGTRLLSSGTDGRMRNWDVYTGINTMINYEGTQHKKVMAKTISVSTNGMLAFHPSGVTCGVYNVATGQLVKSLRGHYANVTSTLFHPYIEELYTGDSSGHILVWTPQVGDELTQQTAASDEEEDDFDDDVDV